MERYGRKRNAIRELSAKISQGTLYESKETISFETVSYFSFAFFPASSWLVGPLTCVPVEQCHSGASAMLCTVQQNLKIHSTWLRVCRIVELEYRTNPPIKNQIRDAHHGDYSNDVAWSKIHTSHLVSCLVLKPSSRETSRLKRNQTIDRSIKLSLSTQVYVPLVLRALHQRQ